jgi:hypothetical protein
LLNFCHQEVFVRVAECAGHLYLDLGDLSWRAVEIGANGWNVIARPPVMFRRPAGMGALPVPTRGGKAACELKPFLNVAEEDLPLVLAWLAAAFRPSGPYPILQFLGEQGSAKSTTQKVLRRAIAEQDQGRYHLTLVDLEIQHDVEDGTSVDVHECEYRFYSEPGLQILWHNGWWPDLAHRDRIFR